MSIATATLRMRLPSGPALGKTRLPITATLFSAVLHGSLAAGVVLTAGFWATEKPKTYVVNLVPAVAAVGSPQGRVETPATPTPPPPAPPRAEEVTPPTRAPELPARDSPRDMPPRARAAALPDRSLPDRSLPTRAPALPKPGDKELPAMASTAKAPPTPTERPTTDVARVPPPPPPVPLGRRDGSPQGSGAMTLNVSDFPFAWYLSRVQAKVTERWAGKALPGQQPVAVFEISREGQVSKLAIEKTSGNSYYDQAALRAITEANPFPPLPPEFTGQTLRVHLGFNFSAERG